MSAVTERLHGALLEALDGYVVAHSDVTVKPLDVDLALPLPRRLRVYLYTLVAGGTRRPGEFKAVLRVPGQRVGEYGAFDFSGDRLAVLAAYREDMDVFVLWDASLHPRFKNGGNVQVQSIAVEEAAATGWARQLRALRQAGTTEAVFACRSETLVEAVVARNSWTGGVPG